jgi:hypothetical protein
MMIGVLQVTLVDVEMFVPRILAVIVITTGLPVGFLPGKTFTSARPMDVEGLGGTTVPLDVVKSMIVAAGMRELASVGNATAVIAVCSVQSSSSS